MDKKTFYTLSVHYMDQGYQRTIAEYEVAYQATRAAKQVCRAVRCSIAIPVCRFVSEVCDRVVAFRAGQPGEIAWDCECGSRHGINIEVCTLCGLIRDELSYLDELPRNHVRAQINTLHSRFRKGL